MSRAEYDSVSNAIKKDTDRLSAYVHNAERALDKAKRDLIDGQSALEAVFTLEKQLNYISGCSWVDSPATLVDKLATQAKETRKEELLGIYDEHLRIINVLCEEYKDSDVLTSLVVLRTLTEAIVGKIV